MKSSLKVMIGSTLPQRKRKRHPSCFLEGFGQTMNKRKPLFVNWLSGLSTDEEIGKDEIDESSNHRGMTQKSSINSTTASVSRDLIDCLQLRKRIRVNLWGADVRYTKPSSSYALHLRPLFIRRGSRLIFSIGPYNDVDLMSMLVKCAWSTGSFWLTMAGGTWHWVLRL